MKKLVSGALKNIAKSVAESTVGRSIPFSAHTVEIPNDIVKRVIQKNNEKTL